MLDVKLTDFTLPELDTALMAMASVSVDLQNKIDLANKYGLPDVDYRNDLDMINLWVAQLINAKVEVRTRLTVNSN